MGLSDPRQRKQGAEGRDLSGRLPHEFNSDRTGCAINPSVGSTDALRKIHRPENSQRHESGSSARRAPDIP